MILGTRTLRTPEFSGLNLFLLRDWIMPIEHLGATCFDAFDEALVRQRLEGEATRIMVPGSRSKELAALNTATSAALRALPERWRDAAELYTVCFFKDPSIIYFRLPRWAHLRVEDAEGNLAELHTAEAHAAWRRAELLPGDLAIHLNFFSAVQRTSLSESEGTLYYRLASLMDNLKFEHLVPSLCLKAPTPEIRP